MKDDSTRARMWLLAAVPVGAVAAIVVSLWPAQKTSKPTRPRDEPTASTSSPALPPPEVVFIEPRPSSSTPPPPVASAAAAIASVAAALDAAGVQLEKIPELQAFFHTLPADADEWSAEQRQAYRDRLFANLEARERALEREIAFAESRGDAEAAEVKKATLANLRATKAKLDRNAR